jgi:hypothetical protein
MTGWDVRIEQLEAARFGSLTPEMKRVALRELTRFSLQCALSAQPGEIDRQQWSVSSIAGRHRSSNLTLRYHKTPVPRAS